MVRRDRRAVLAAVGAGVATGGCLDRLGGLTGGGSARQVSLTVKAPARDDDPFADGIAREVTSWLQTAGMSTSLASLAPSELRAQVLEDHEFELFVSRVPARFRDPDALYSLLHSRYAVGSGWNNPFGLTSEEIDDLLDGQRRRSGQDREAAVGDLARAVAEREPFSVVCFPAEIRAARRDRFVGFSGASLDEPTGLLSLQRAESEGSDDGADSRAATLHLATTDELATETLNPLSTAGDASTAITRLLYDPLGRRLDDGLVPWLAVEWTFTDDGDAPRGTVRLREDAVWHDGEPVTADDVAFTYAFMADVRLASDDDPIPVPRFLGRTSLVDEVIVVDDRTATIRFVDCDGSVARRALTVPILPEHVWRERTEPADGDGGQRFAADVLETSNVPPVGSGPLAYGGNVPGERLSLERNEEHFLSDAALTPPLDQFAGRPAFDRLVFEVVGAHTAAVERVASGNADGTVTPLSPETVPRVARAEALRLYTDDTDAFYVVGYNARREHLSNPQFRVVLGGLLDQDALVRSVFQGYATPAASPLEGTPWLPEPLHWAGEDPVTPFLGTDGDLDVERVRDAFRDVGYRYDDDALVTG